MPERERRDVADQYRSFVECAPVAIAMFDRDMRYLAASRRWVEDHGLLGQAVEGRSHYDVFPDMPQRWRDIHRRALSGEVCSRDEDRHERADGTVLWVRWDAWPWFDQDGGIGGILIFTEDITHRKLAEEEVRLERERLRASEDRYRAIFTAAPNPTVVIDIRGTIQAVNPAALAAFGYSSVELIGANVVILMPRAEAAAHDGYLRRYAETGQGAIIGIGRVVPARRKDGALFPVELTVTTWNNEDGRQLFCGTIVDLSERKRAEDALADAQRLEAVALLAGGVAHDFNNALAVIQGNLELAEAHVADPMARRLVSRSLKAAKLASTITMRLLSLARNPEGEARALSLNDLVRETMPLLEILAAGAWSVRLGLADEVWPTLVHPGEVCSALLNLAANARDAMPGGGVIRIATENVHVEEPEALLEGQCLPGDYVCLSVTDNGEGMSGEVLAKVWEPFYSTKRAGRGTGLGLTTVRNMTRLAHGFASIASAPGEGTAVRLYLPRAPSAQGAQVPADPASIPFGDGETILVVEDDDEVRETTMGRLEVLGYAVRDARDGEQAVIELTRDATIDLVFSDVAMPRMSGYQLARWIGVHRPSVAVVLTSGFAGYTGGGRDDGQAVLYKPYTREQLARCIRQALVEARSRTRLHSRGDQRAAQDQPQNT